MDVTALRCPSCAAPVDLAAGAAHTCRYCGAALVIDAPRAAKPRRTRSHVRYVVVLTRCGPSNYARVEAVLRARGISAESAHACVRSSPCELPTWDGVISPDDLARQLEEAGAQARVDAHVTTEELPPDVRVVLEDAGTDRVGVMRAIRAFIDMDMAATKALIARAPVMLVESMDGERGRAFRDALVSAGARVTMTDLE